MGKVKLLSLLFVSVAVLSGCVSEGTHKKNLKSAKERDMTVGLVQKEVRVGMSQTDVVSALGSPNMVTRGGEGKEAWVYDKIATEASYSKSSGGIGGGLGAGVGTVLTLGMFSASKQSGASSSTQKTLTVVIRFNKAGMVESFTYHSTKF